MEYYGSVRWVHIACATLSITLFALRGTLQLMAVDWRRWRWLRIAPHVNDTLLLGMAIALTVMSSQYPLQQTWLTAKVIALLVHIGAGYWALLPGRSVPHRRLAFVVSMLAVAYIVAVAMRRSATLGLLAP